MKSKTAFVWSESIVKLYPIAGIDPDVITVVQPAYFELYNPIGHYKSLQNRIFRISFIGI